MNFRKIICYLGLILMVLMHVKVYAQEDCMAIFKKATDQVRSMRLLSKSNGFEMSCRVVITPEKGAAMHERMKIVSSNGKYQCSTEQYSLFQDEYTLVVIQRDKKNVFITRPLPEQLQQNQFTQMIKLQDSLQQHLIVKACVKEFGTVQNDEGYMKIVFVPDKRLEGLGLKSITYWIELEEYEVKKIAIDYTSGSVYGIKRYEMIVDAMNAQSTSTPFKGKALAQALQKDKLRDEFRNYQLIDKRN
jgi:hypothetical protein